MSQVDRRLAGGGEERFYTCVKQPFTSGPVLCDEVSTHLYACPAGVTADSASRGREWTGFVLLNNAKTKPIGSR